jgi:hypothetical protein
MKNRNSEARNGITAGLLLIGIGVLMLTNWWWPGIMVVLGIAIGAGLAFKGRYVAAAIVAIIFFSIPLVTDTVVPWNIFIPMVLIGLGVVIVSKAFILKDENESGQVPEPK